jgi:hypothetical protein
MTTRERIARAIEARADEIEDAMERPEAADEPAQVFPRLRRILSPRVEGLREAARIARGKPA